MEFVHKRDFVARLDLESWGKILHCPKQILLKGAGQSAPGGVVFDKIPESSESWQAGIKKASVSVRSLRISELVS